MAEDLGERTEPATERRRTQARERGHVAKSPDLAGALILLVGIAGLHFFGAGMVAFFDKSLHYCATEAWIDLEADRARAELTRLSLLAGWALLPWTLAVVATALVVHLFQTGGLLVATNRTYFDPNRLNPLAGLARLFSMRGLIKTVLDSLKVILIGVVTFQFFAGEMVHLTGLAGMDFPHQADYAWDRLLLLSYEIVAIFVVLGIIDYSYQRFQYERELRMTREEIRQETKDIEGDPLIRARRRQIQARLARQRMLREVPEAEVVITNPLELAVAIKYEYPEMDAPVVVAKGAGFVAQKIRDLARQYKIPVVENKPLAQLLFKKTELGRAIPDETFVAVAEILAYVYRITGRRITGPPPTREKSAAGQKSAAGNG